MSKFTGWPDEALRFYEGLEADNSRTYWTTHKAVYDNDIKGRTEALLAELAPTFGEGKIFRPYRDVRFAKDKSPYKTAMGAYVEGKTGSGYYLQLSAEGLYAAGGQYGMAGDQVERLRAAVDADASGTDIEGILAALRKGGFTIGGEALKTVPRGYDKDHPRAQLLRHKSLYAGREFGAPAWLHTAKAKAKIVETWRALAPMREWLEKHVGPSTQPAERRR